MKLTPRQAEVICAAQFRAREPHSLIAHELGIREHSVRYTLRGLISNGAIKPAVYLNPFKLGYSKFQIFFSLHGTKDAQRKFLQALVLSPYTAWVAECAGNYQYVLTLCLRNTHELGEFLDAIEKQFRVTFFDRVFAIVNRFSLFSKTYLGPDRISKQYLSIGETIANRFLDDIDQRILTALAGDALLSHYEIARKIQVPRSTIDSRVKKLESEGVIAGHIYFIRALKLGALPYVLLINTSGVRARLRDKLFRFAKQHPTIVNFSECIGSWDFEYTAEVFHPQEISAVVQELHSLFNSEIQRIQVVALTQQLQSSNFMRTWQKSDFIQYFGSRTV